MRAMGVINNQLSRELNRELSKAKSVANSSKFNGLKIESGLYEVFLNQCSNRFKL